MNLTTFVQATARGIKESADLVLSDTHPISIAWGVATEPDTIMVTTDEGDTFYLKVTRL